MAEPSTSISLISTLALYKHIGYSAGSQNVYCKARHQLDISAASVKSAE